MTETQFDAKTLQNKLRQVQALLDRAEHPNTPPAEAEESRRKAETLMRKYQIEEEAARQGRIAEGLESIKPIIDEFPICAYNSQYRDHYISLMYNIVAHVGNIEMAYKYVSGEQMGFMVGFESDVRYAQTLYTSLRLHFAQTLEPTYDPSVSYEENVYRMRTAGIERHRIAQMIWPDGRPKGTPEVSDLYKRACSARGEDPKVVGRSTNVKTYRKSFADSYVGRIDMRLWEMRQSEPGAELQLRGRKQAVEDLFYERFPHLKPVTREDRQIGEGVRGGPNGNCEKCLKAKSRYCRDHNYLRPTMPKSRPHSRLGSSMGRDAADSAELGSNSSSGRKGVE
jgi:hypothetical protein